MTLDEFQIIREHLPKNPGVYKFIGPDKEILYVGKAKNLKKRVSSYFLNRYNQPYKIKSLVRNAVHIEYVVVNTESDALLLENNLIKKIQPKYNVNLKDGKSYTYICIKNERFPRVFFTRKLIKDGSTYFGPYTSKHKAKVILDLIKTLFPLRTCSLFLSEKNIESGKFKVCLEYHIKRCKGPCENLESEESYNEKIKQVSNILRGNFGEVKGYLKSEMEEAIELLEFERAQDIKEKLEVFQEYQSKSTIVNPNISNLDVYGMLQDDDMTYVNYIRVVNGAVIYANTFELKNNLEEAPSKVLSYAINQLRVTYQSDAPEVVVPMKVELIDERLTQTIPKIGDKKKLLELSMNNASYHMKQKRKETATYARRITSAERILTTLKNDLQMDIMPLHIECFDNSNFQGSYPVSSCVVFKNARPSKKDYRHFHVKTVEGPNDFASMEEVVQRRYRRLIQEGESLPQLIIIDGGKGQLSAANKIVKNLGIQNKVTLIGIAKRLEEIFFPDDPIPLYINKKSESLKLIQQLRNEAHRFAITFHRNQRSKYFTTSEVSDIPGIGKVLSEKLLVQFKSLKRIKEADHSDLASVVGKSKADQIWNYLHPKEEE